MSIRPLVLGLLAAPFLLSACGENYEPIRTTEYFPYGNQRTAGSGVAYVLAKMLPEKELKLAPERVPELKLEPVSEKRVIKEMQAPSAAVTTEETPMEEVFQDAQKK